jgi:hypothetical protein
MGNDDLRGWVEMKAKIGRFEQFDYIENTDE